MGYLIGGAGEGPEEEIVQSDKDYSNLSDSQLLKLRDQTVKDIAKFNNFQMVRKICLNSAYGAIGNEWFRYYKLANAEAITLSGQTSIRWIENKLNKYLNDLLKTDKDYVIAVDTDSVYLNLGPLVDKFLSKQKDDKEKVVNLLDKVCQDQLEPFIDKCYVELADYVNAYDQKMQMKRENIADRGIWTAKKRYILNVHNSEGVQYAEPKLKIMGIEAIKSSTPEVCRDKFKEIFKVIINGTQDDTHKFIADFKKEWKQLPPESVSFPRGCNIVKNGITWADPKTIYRKACPIHVRGALLYNHYIKEKGLDKKYELVNNGEKIKFCYLKTPNPIKENVIGYTNDLPKELDLHRFIDYNKQYEKAFVEPIKHLLDALEWEVEPTATLEDFFG